MVRDDQTKVKIGDKEVDAKIKGIELNTEHTPVDNPEAHGDKYRGRTHVNFSVEIKDVSEELKNYLIWGEPDPEIQSTEVAEMPSGDEVEEVTFSTDQENHSPGLLENLWYALQDHEDRLEKLEGFLDDFMEPEEKSVADKVREKVIGNIEHHQALHDSDPTTSEIADKIGEPLDLTTSWLNIMEAQGELESYKVGNSDLWRLAE